MKTDSNMHYQIRLWCIENIPMKNSRRQWRFEYPKDQKYAEPYEFTPFFNCAEHETVFNLQFQLAQT